MTLPLLPLVLSDRTRIWVPESESEVADRDFREVRAHVLERDGHACRYCGFRDTGMYMEINHRDGDHTHNDPSNLVTACMHCHAVHHVGFWGSPKRGASIAWLPEFTQAEVSALSRAIIVARHGLRFAIPGTDDLSDVTRRCIEIEDASSILEGALDGRAYEARRRLGSFDPAHLGAAFSDMTDEQYADRERLLEGFRLVLPFHVTKGPDRTDISSELAARWLATGGAFEGMAPHTWRRLAA